MTTSGRAARTTAASAAVSSRWLWMLYDTTRSGTPEPCSTRPASDPAGQVGGADHAGAVAQLRRAHLGHRQPGALGQRVEV